MSSQASWSVRPAWVSDRQVSNAIAWARATRRRRALDPSGQPVSRTPSAGFRSDGRELSLGAGGYIVKPRGELHSMWNAGSVPARMIEIISPAGFEEYFAELAAAVAAKGGRPDPSISGPIAERYGLSFDMTEVPDLVARHDLMRPAVDPAEPGEMS